MSRSVERKREKTDIDNDSIQSICAIRGKQTPKVILSFVQL